MKSYQSASWSQKRPENPPTLLALRPREAAAAIGISLSKLEKMTAAGEIESVLAGRCRLYEVEVLKAYLQSRRVGQEVAS